MQARKRFRLRPILGESNPPKPPALPEPAEERPIRASLKKSYSKPSIRTSPIPKRPGERERLAEIFETYGWKNPERYVKLRRDRVFGALEDRMYDPMASPKERQEARKAFDDFMRGKLSVAEYNRLAQQFGLPKKSPNSR